MITTAVSAYARRSGGAELVAVLIKHPSLASYQRQRGWASASLRSSPQATDTSFLQD